MSVQLLPEEREAIANALKAIERVYAYCWVMMEHELDMSDRIADIHAATACLSLELPELVALIDGERLEGILCNPSLRVLLTASEAARRMKEKHRSPEAADAVIESVKQLYDYETAF